MLWDDEGTNNGSEVRYIECSTTFLSCSDHAHGCSIRVGHLRKANLVELAEIGD